MTRTLGGRMAVVTVGLGLAVTMAACSSNSSNSASSGSSTTVASASPTTVAAPATTTTVAALIKTAGNANLGAILTDASGKTLYTRDTDPAGGSSCTGSCATTWPPLLLPAGSTSPGAVPTGVTGTLTSFARTDTGTQVALSGKALYTFSGDSAAGQTNGDGVGGIWHVAKVS